MSGTSSLLPILVVDGLGLFTRSFAVNETVNTNGDAVGGIIGFMKALGGIISHLNPGSVYVVWEQGGGTTRRKKLYPEYKANRGKAPSRQQYGLASSSGNNKAWQLQVLTAALGQMPVCQIYVPDTEGDDVIAYLVKRKFQLRSSTKYLVSTDKDFYQLLEDQTVRVFDPVTKTIVDSNVVMDKFGIPPRNLCLARCVAGDTSDNISGVPGVGIKTVHKAYPGIRDATVDRDLTWLFEAAEKATKGLGDDDAVVGVTPRSILFSEAHTKRRPRSQLKCHQSILDHKSVVERNWKLMYLDTGCLTSPQISKINTRVDGFVPSTWNRFEWIKVLRAADVVITEDMDRTFTEMKSLVRFESDGMSTSSS